MDHKTKQGFDIEEIKSRASGRGLEILEHVAGIDAELLDGKHHPCPKCEGTDRFRMIDDTAGSIYCNQCFNENNGDSIAAVQWMRGITFQEALASIGEYLQLTPQSAKPKAGPSKEWFYTDQEGNPLYQVTRIEYIEKGELKKRFIQKQIGRAHV